MQCPRFELGPLTPQKKIENTLHASLSKITDIFSIVFSHYSLF